MNHDADLEVRAPMTALSTSLPDRRRLLGMAVPFIAVLGSMIAGLLLIAASGKDVPDAIEAFMDGAFGSAFAIGASINRAVALSLALSFVVTIFPARRAARMNPVEALRYE